MVAIVPAALIWAANTAMLGLSRHVYVLATNRQIPSWLGKLNRRFQTPHVAILTAAVIAFGLVATTDVDLLGGLFAFGATIAFTIAHLSIIRLRITDPDRERPFRIPFDVAIGGSRAAAAGADRRGADGARLGQRDRSTTTPRAGSAAAGWCSAWSATSIYRKGFEGTTADRAGRGAGRGAGQGRARGRVRRHPRAGLRDQARRRHRRHRGAPRRRRRRPRARRPRSSR